MTTPPEGNDPSQEGASRTLARLPSPDDVDDRIPRSFVQLLPRRTLIKAFWLLVLLFGIVTFQRNSAKFASMFTNTFSPAPPSTPRVVPGRDMPKTKIEPKIDLKMDKKGRP